MPLYNYRCNSCNTSWEAMYSIANRKEPEGKPCPECHQLKVENYISEPPSMGDPVRLGIRRPDNGFKEVLQKINERAPGSRLKDSSNLTRM